jgi:hypothetical protein
MPESLTAAGGQREGAQCQKRSIQMLVNAPSRFPSKGRVGLGAWFVGMGDLEVEDAQQSQLLQEYQTQKNNTTKKQTNQTDKHQ